MFDDFKKLLSVFNDHSVKYLLVGGYAVSLHAQPRATQDLDLFIKGTRRARRRWMEMSVLREPEEPPSSSQGISQSI